MSNVVELPIQRTANFHATYNGDCTHMVGEVVGPTTYGQLQVAVDASYDEAADKTRVGFAPANQHDLDAYRARLEAVRS